MRDVMTTIYKFEELTESAKETARQWWRNCENQDFDTEFIYDDVVRMGTLLGIDINTHAVKLMGGGVRHEPTIYYSGFSSQGDGACFEGSYRYKKGTVKAILAETSAGNDDASKGDKELLRIATALYNLQRVNFYQLTASTRHSGHYYHSGCMSVECDRKDGKIWTAGAEDEMTQLMRDFADWIYSSLEAEYDYRMSDENVDESIIINEYEFNEEGEIV